MRADLFSISDLGPREMAAWQQLSARAASPNPFIEPDFVLPATRAWGVADVGVLVVADGNEWLSAVPVRRVRSWRSVPGPCLVAWRHLYCYLGTPLLAGDDKEAILATLIRRGLQSESCFALDWIDVDGPVAEDDWDDDEEEGAEDVPDDDDAVPQPAAINAMTPTAPARPPQRHLSMG